MGVGNGNGNGRGYVAWPALEELTRNLPEELQPTHAAYLAQAEKLERILGELDFEAAPTVGDVVRIAGAFAETMMQGSVFQTHAVLHTLQMLAKLQSQSLASPLPPDGESSPEGPD